VQEKDDAAHEGNGTDAKSATPFDKEMVRVRIEFIPLATKHFG